MIDLPCCNSGMTREVMRKPAADGGCEQVVYWCAWCGAVRVDVEFDGRNRPGSLEVPNLTDPNRETDLSDI